MRFPTCPTSRSSSSREYPGQAPQVVEDQVTYPLSTAMLGVPYAEVVRGYSFFGLSFVYIIFEDGIDLVLGKKSRPRVAELPCPGRLPAGVDSDPRPGCDRCRLDLRIRTRRSELEITIWPSSGVHPGLAVFATSSRPCPGVAEVASVGGHVRQYQVEVDPESTGRLRTLARPRSPRAIQRSNLRRWRQAHRTGGDGVYGARSRGYMTLHSRSRAGGGRQRTSSGTAILLRNIATVSLGPELRRGLTDLDGEGEAAAGIVIMRFGENALETIRNVKAKARGARRRICPPACRNRAGLRPGAADRKSGRQPAPESFSSRR